METSAAQRLVNISLEVLLVVLLVSAALVAWRNVRLGRGDQKAAWRVAGVLFVTGVTSWALVASHVPTEWEVYLLVLGLSWASFSAGFVGLLYLAIEPFIRRFWPDALISWVRMVNGRVRDPLVASHILVGVSAGLVIALLVSVSNSATNVLASPLPTGGSVRSTRFLFGFLLNNFGFSAFLATGGILVLVLLRSVVGRTVVADALFVVLLSSVLSPLYPVSTAAMVGWLLRALAFATYVWILRRFGLLALAALLFASNVVQKFPLAVASWYAAYSLTTPVLIAAVAAWSLHAILTSRPASESSPVHFTHE